MDREINDELVEKLKRVRTISESSNDEVKDLISRRRKELEMAGVYGDETDPTYLQAVVLYCKGNYGYDDNVERFRKAFNSLRDAMNLSGDYEKEGELIGDN